MLWHAGPKTTWCCGARKKLSIGMIIFLNWRKPDLGKIVYKKENKCNKPDGSPWNTRATGLQGLNPMRFLTRNATNPSGPTCFVTAARWNTMEHPSDGTLGTQSKGTAPPSPGRSVLAAFASGDLHSRTTRDAQGVVATTARCVGSFGFTNPLGMRIHRLRPEHY